jgi:hypothetical protein
VRYDFWIPVLLSWLMSIVILPGLALAQDAPGEGSRLPAAGGRFEVSGVMGFVNFPDESSQYHVLVEGTARIRIARGLGFAPEFTYMYYSRQDRDLVFLPNVTYEFRRGKRVVPYFIGGVGILNHRETWDHFDWSATGRFISGGFGTKIFLRSRIFAAAEARIGWEPHIRVTGSLGYVLAK